MWWYHTSTGSLCVAGHDPETGLCAEGGGPVMSDADLAARLRANYPKTVRFVVDRYIKEHARSACPSCGLRGVPQSWRDATLAALGIDPTLPVETLKRLWDAHDCRDDGDEL